MDKARLYSSWQELVTYDDNGPKHAELLKTKTYNAVLVGLNAGQKIPPHSAPDASYHFLEGTGWMITDGERIAVTQGATIVVPAGTYRGIEAETRLAVLASHSVPKKNPAAPMPVKRMGLIGLAGMVVMAFVMITFGLMMGNSNPMASLMFRSDGPLGMGLWAIMIVPFAVMILMMGGMFFAMRGKMRRGKHKQEKHTHDPSKHMAMTAESESASTFSVAGISCAHCKMTIESGISEIPGVNAVEVEVKAKKVTVDFSAPATKDEISAQLAEIGYPAD